MLLQRWLTDDDSGVSEPVNQDRMIFLLHGKMAWGIKNLNAFVLLPANKISVDARVRALSVLSRISKMEDLEVDMDQVAIDKQLKLILYCRDLEVLNMSQSTLEFENCDKHSLARSIWLAKRGDLVGLHLICKLCFDYEIDDNQLWNNVLMTLMQKNDVLHV